MTKAEQKAARDLRDADWRWLFNSMQGRRIARELIANSGLMMPIMSETPLLTAHAEGRRSMGAEIYARLTDVTESGDRAAVLAEVLLPHVRDSRPRRNADDADPGDE